jgi:hypothetical protein
MEERSPYNFIDIAHGFFARPDKAGNGIDLTSWSVGIPGNFKCL